jgi:threonine dehydratase
MVLQARNVIRPYLRPTPLVSYPALNELLEANVYVKREDCQPISAFKIRGGINLLSNLAPQDRERGLITASTGNHGQSIAYACRLFGARCIVYVPEGANPLKAKAMETLGAQVVARGRVFEEARQLAERRAAESGMRYVHPADEPLLIAGVATATLELLEEVPDLVALLVPLGGGSSAAGACIVTRAVAPDCAVVAIQSAQAPAGYRSWKEGRLMEAPMESRAEGLATGAGYQLPQSILRDGLSDFLLVDDREMQAAVRIYLERCHTLSELAGAAALAGAIQVLDRLRGKKIGLILSGANITLDQLQEILGMPQDPP